MNVEIIYKVCCCNLLVIQLIDILVLNDDASPKVRSDIVLNWPDP